MGTSNIPFSHSSSLPKTPIVTIFLSKTPPFLSKTPHKHHFPIKKHPFSYQKHLKNTHFPIKTSNTPIFTPKNLKNTHFPMKNAHFPIKIRRFAPPATVFCASRSRQTCAITRFSPNSSHFRPKMGQK
jgi:hypothetical protein